jgi:hypothetical protein
MACDEVGDDGHEVLLEFGLGSFTFRRSHFCVKNHEAAPTGTEDGLDEFESDPADPVSMCDHNRLDSSADGALQKGDKTFPVGVDPRRDIFNDFVVWVLGDEELTLPDEVFFLFLGGDAAVDDIGPALGDLRFGGAVATLGSIIISGWDLEEPFDVREAIEALATESGVADFELLLDFFGCDI